ncbi:hypothetical protein [Actinokineospora bangkokensis]|uniref:hypothetical protein n=1 Tax=Actinokineospora bangkokensis TaxID=1193682 RepID=UPI001177E554|nr:hypothetical protein [Actinokineospora bangkokensis]
MTAWLGVEAPVVEVAEPALVTDVVSESSGELDDERVVVRFNVVGLQPDTDLGGQPGCYVELSLAGDGESLHPKDTFHRRLVLVLDAVTRVLRVFESVAAQVPGSRALQGRVGAQSGWFAAAESERLWSEEDLAGLDASDIGVGVLRGSGHTVLLVRTEHGVFERRIRTAAALNPRADHGPEAERAAQSAAATWGLPDFVVSPAVERKGTGVREISDGLVVVGGRGLVIQVKSRNGELGDTTKETTWITSKAGAGGRQVDGTARRLADRSSTMINGRGRTIEINGPAVSWLGVVILDHPDPPEDLSIQRLPTRVPTTVLLRRDWEFLFDQLKSSHAVLDYIARVAGDAHIPLGREPVRYYELAAADAEAVTPPLDPARLGPGTPASLPLLPMAPAGADDPDAHDMIRIICEEIALTDHDNPADIARILATIDQLPIGYRTDLGRLLLTTLSGFRASTRPGSVGWRSRVYRAEPPQPQLGFIACTTLDESTQNAFRSWVLLRHHEHGTARGDLNTLTTVAILLTPRTDGVREWDTSTMAITGDPGLTDDDVTTYRRFWSS